MWVWWIGHLSPKCISVGPTIALIIRINVWAMQLIKLPFPCSNNWTKSRCWEHVIFVHLPFGVNHWVWCIHTTIYQFDPFSRSPQGGPLVRLFPDLTYHGAHEMRIPPMMNVEVGELLTSMFVTLPWAFRGCKKRKPHAIHMVRFLAPVTKHHVLPVIGQTALLALIRRAPPIASWV